MFVISVWTKLSDISISNVYECPVNVYYCPEIAVYAVMLCMMFNFYNIDEGVWLFFFDNINKQILLFKILYGGVF